MMKYKYRFKNIHLFEYKAMEAYFQKMAAQGWMLDKSRTWYFRFRACAPCVMYFHIGFDSKIRYTSLAYAEGSKSDYAAFMKSFGYSYISSIGIMQVFASPQDDPMFNEPEIDEAAFRFAVHKDEWSKTVIPFFFVLFSTLIFSPLDIEVLSSNTLLLFAAFLILSLVYLGAMTIPYIRYLLHHRVRDDLNLASIKYDLAAILPLIVLYGMLYLALPGSMFGFLLIIVGIVFLGRACLHLVHRHGKHLLFWKICITSCIIILYINLTFLYPKDVKSFDTDAKQPFMTAQDFGKTPKDTYFDYQKSILMMRQDYVDQDVSYAYYEFMDSPLATYCRDKILHRYQVEMSQMKQVDGVRIYHESASEDGGELVIFMKKNTIMILFDYQDEYFTFFKNHV